MKISTRALMTFAAIAVLGGVLQAGMLWVALALALTAPAALGLFAGLAILPGATALMLLRLPGSGFITMLLSGLISAPFVPPAGGSGIYIFGALGLLLELPFAATRYRRWGAGLLLGTAAAIGTLMGVLWFLIADAAFPLWVRLSMSVGLALSMVFFSWVGRLIAIRTERTGVVRGLARPAGGRRSPAGIGVDGEPR